MPTKGAGLSHGEVRLILCGVHLASAADVQPLESFHISAFSFLLFFFPLIKKKPTAKRILWFSSDIQQAARMQSST